MLISYLLEVIQAQYPDSTVEWDFMPLTGADNVDIISGVILDKGGTNPALNGKADWLDPVITELGWMYEGYNMACAGPNDAPTNFGDTFGFHTWIYFTDITTDQTIWCKEWLEDEGDEKLNSLRLCLNLMGGQFVVLYNPSDVNTHLREFSLTDEFNYNYQKMGIFAKFGWHYVAVNFKTDPATGFASVWMYMIGHDQCKMVSNTFRLSGPIVDDNKFILCLGGTAYHNQATLQYELTYPLMALVNSVVFISGEVIERWHAMDAFGLQCHDY